MYVRHFRGLRVAVYSQKKEKKKKKKLIDLVVVVNITPPGKDGSR